MNDNTEPKNNEKNSDTHYLKKPLLEETNTPNPLQGPIKDSDQLYHFIQDVHDATLPKLWGIFLNEDYLSLGNEPLALGHHAQPENFATGTLFHFYALFFAKRFLIVTNHTTDDAAPSDGDKDLIRRLQADAQALSFKPHFADYVIVAGDHYWSMSKQDGTACHCGQQHNIPEM